MTKPENSNKVVSSLRKSMKQISESGDVSPEFTLSEDDVSILISAIMDIIPDLDSGGELEDNLSASDRRNSLEDDINAVLESHGVEISDRPAVLQDFSVSAKLAVDHQALVVMPASPPELWKSGQGETAIEFLHRVYGPQVKARLLTYTWLEEHDPALGNSVSTMGYRKRLPPDELPVTRQEETDQAYKRLVAEIGKDRFDEVARVANALQKRASRKKADADDLSM